MRALLLASLMTVSSLVAGGFNAARADIIIGIAAPLTGIYAPLGQQIEIGAQQAANEINEAGGINGCLLYTSPSPRDQRGSRMPSSA